MVPRLVVSACIVKTFIPQMEPVVTGEDAAAVQRYLQSGGWLTEFRETRHFEARLREYTGAPHCVAAPSGTMALFLALKACGIGDGDHVIVPDLTMAATATAVTLAGGHVVFVDIEPRSLCLDLDAADRAITTRTKAVLFVSLNGRSPSAMLDYFERWRARGIYVIEDAAQSLGSFHRGRHLGTLGACGCLSFSSQKLVTTGQGGAVLTGDDALLERMRLLRDFGRLEGGSDHYLSIGWNLKFTDLQAVIGHSQMQRITELVSRKRMIYRRYVESLDGLRGVELVETDLNAVTPWFVDILVEPERKAALMQYLREHGIGSRPMYPALHGEPAFAVAGDFPVAVDVSARALWLPSAVSLTDEQIATVCRTIRHFFKG